MAMLPKIQGFICVSALALAAAAAMPAVASAQAGDVQPAEAQSSDSMRLSGGVRLSAAYDPIEIEVPELIAAPGFGEGADTVSGPAGASSGSAGVTAAANTAANSGDARALLSPDSEGSASALPWFQRFTVAPTEPQILWTNSENFEMQAGDRWGVTLGYSQGERSAQTFELEDFRAGAFFELTERVRLGGQLRFTSPEEEIFGEESEDRAPEVRFESAFKF
ncbi:NtrZ family periplasmic regulatory protein [Maricaulaceae bacterium MS644]